MSSDALAVFAPYDTQFDAASACVWCWL